MATSAPLNGFIEIAGPEKRRFDEFIQQQLSALNDPREVITDPHARYFGTELTEDSIVPIGDVELGEIRFEDWLSRSTAAATTARQTA